MEFNLAESYQILDRLKTLKLSDGDDGDLQKKGIHPELGEVNLQQLLATWTIHELGHLNQLSRVKVKQYKEAVGPWKAYSRILNQKQYGCTNTITATNRGRT